MIDVATFASKRSIKGVAKIYKEEQKFGKMYETIYDKYELRQITYMGKNEAKPLAGKPGLLHIFFITFLLLPLEPKR